MLVEEGGRRSRGGKKVRIVRGTVSLEVGGGERRRGEGEGNILRDRQDELEYDRSKVKDAHARKAILRALISPPAS